MKRKMISCFIFLLVCIAVIAVGFVVYTRKQQELEPMRHDLQRISEESYDSVFLSMYPLNGYSEEDFAFYRGTDTVISAYSIPKLSVLAEYMELVLDGRNELNNVFWGLDPVAIWNSCGKNVDKWNRQLQESVFACLQENPEISFEVMLAYPGIEYWTSMTEEEMDTVLTVYRNLLYSLETYENVTIYYLGAEEWLIANPSSYTDAMDVNEVVARQIFLYTFCDHVYEITTENADSYFESLRTLVVKERNNPSVYPDFSQWKLVFLGDSVIGNYKGSCSVPGVITGLTGADTYNYALGGSQATDYEGYNVAFPDRVEQFIARELGVTQDDVSFPYESLADNGSNICFLIHYGLNDYFNGRMVEDAEAPDTAHSYAGALRVGIKRLQEVYPDATIIIMTPPYCELFSAGTEKNGEEGGVLAEYVAVVEQIAQEQNVICMNNYTGMGITQENAYLYLEGGCHFNEYGRWVLGNRIIKVLQELQ